MYERAQKLSKPKTQNNIRNPFILKEEKKFKDRIIKIFGHFLKQKKKKRKKEIRKERNL